ncbi:MAG: S8 family peptidase [Bacteroidetes bacterium]|nr:S8 family peptidase [Bacteroidota bacterium]
MKKTYSFFFALLIFSINAFAQGKMNLALALKNNPASTEIIDIFIKGDILTIQQLCANVNGKVNYFSGDIAAIKIPAASLSTFALHPKIERLEAFPPHYKPMNDTMLLHNNVGPVHSGTTPLTQGYNGNGVVIGIIDTGIDFSHPDLRDSVGNTRIKYLWDERLPVAANTPSYGYGQEWDNIGIDGGLAAASTDIDWNGHGTHVAGIAAGNGLASGNYKGVAPKADIVMVVYDFYTYNPTSMTDAVDYIYSKANLLGKPCVINASLGSYLGSHDGLDLEAQLIKNMITAQPGRAFVASAGNAGDVDYHLGYTVTSDTNFTFFQGSSGVNIGIYADTADFNNVDFAIGVDQLSPTHSLRGTTPFSDISTHLFVLKNDTIYNAGNRIGIVQSYGSLIGGVYSMEFNILSDSIGYVWRLITTGSGKFDVWDFNIISSGLPSMATMPDSMNYKFPDLNQTICSGFQCLNEVITVGNYTNRKSVLNYNSVLYVDPFRTPGQRHPNSSSGPTRDGRIKPDIAAPGDFTMSCSLLSNLPLDAVTYPDYYDPGGYHTRGGGTSASGPGVAGIAALYLQKNPTANAMDVKNAIINCATVDGFTGAVPNNQYGYGKANAFTALTGCLVTDVEEGSESTFNIYPNPTLSGTDIQIEFQDLSANPNSTLIIYNSIGQVIATEQIKDSSVQLKAFAPGIYFCKLVSEGRIIATQKMIIL